MFQRPFKSNNNEAVWKIILHKNDDGEKIRKREKELEELTLYFKYIQIESSITDRWTDSQKKIKNRHRHF